MMQTRSSTPLNSPEAQLVAISLLSLFLEMAMIRFINSTVQVMAYFNNFLVLSAFFGLGFGSLLVRKRSNLYEVFPVAFAATILLMAFLDHYGVVYSSEEEVVWSAMDANLSRNLPMPLVVVLVVILNFLCFVPLGYKLGECLASFDNRLRAYSYDLLGSILGISAFGLCSFFGTPPWLWFTCAALLAFMIGLRARKSVVMSFFALAIGFSLLPRAGTWSPYYKVSWEELTSEHADGNKPLGYAILVDKLRIQDALDFTVKITEGEYQGWLDYYRLPYRLIKPESVLILGGGAGNDATIALESGVKQIFAVEIDPVIVGLGNTLHPHRPYLDPKVTPINEDARAFLEYNTRRFDLVVMNALDSHMNLPGLANLRLESYMYTVEAFRDVRKAMHENSVFVVNLSSTRPWMGHRLYWSLTEAFQKKPVLLATRNSPYESLAFVYAPDSLLDRIGSDDPALIRRDLTPFEAARDVKLSTDDWPHLYLYSNSIPTVYLLVLGSLLILTYAAFSFVGIDRKERGNLPLFFFGAGFMLLETRCLTQFALFFGATWLVSAIVVGTILMVVFLGNLFVMWKPAINRNLCYALLAVSLMLQYFLPLDFLHEYSFAGRIFVAGGWFGIPVLFAALLFSDSFKHVQETSTAFGANLLGVVVGGGMEFLSIVVGLQALSLIALLLYFMAFLAERGGDTPYP